MSMSVRPRNICDARTLVGFEDGLTRRRGIIQRKSLAETLSSDINSNGTEVSHIQKGVASVKAHPISETVPRGDIPNCHGPPRQSRQSIPEHIQ